MRLKWARVGLEWGWSEVGGGLEWGWSGAGVRLEVGYNWAEVV